MRTEKTFRFIPTYFAQTGTGNFAGSKSRGWTYHTIAGKSGPEIKGKIPVEEREELVPREPDEPNVINFDLTEKRRTVVEYAEGDIKLRLSIHTDQTTSDKAHDILLRIIDNKLDNFVTLVCDSEHEDHKYDNERLWSLKKMIY